MLNTNVLSALQLFFYHKNDKLILKIDVDTNDLQFAGVYFYIFVAE